jgi:hypothetical protein
MVLALASLNPSWLGQEQRDFFSENPRIFAEAL